MHNLKDDFKSFDDEPIENFKKFDDDDDEFKKIDLNLNFKKFDTQEEFKTIDLKSNFKRFNLIDHNKNLAFNPIRGPILSTEYFGINTEKLNSSTEKFKTFTEFCKESTELIKFSSEKFKCSDDILNYIKSHPDFRSMSKDNICYCSCYCISGGLHLLTFGTGFLAGSVAGLALTGHGLSNDAIMAIGTVAGSIAGAGVRTGAYIIITEIEGKPISAINLILEGTSGVFTGGLAGFLGAKAEIVKFNYNLIVKNTIKNGHYVYKYFDLESKGNIALISGKHTADHSGYGLIHILSQHPDVGNALGFSNSQITSALNGNWSMLKKIARSFVDILTTEPYGISAKGAADLIWKVGEKFIKVGLSYEEWMSFGSKVIIQANLISAKNVMQQFLSPTEIDAIADLILIIT
ncbi:unnamed protein product [Brachionus calyciflorus]|uniref:Uncharacterized protein n=1 Tax=Brachionus calyciflorus TaxID=104777 RepID=A0A813S9C4_9BILA|nr:unnamed protein product [Brachionus calyciflorus]